jgi:hypothetical protein
MSPLVDGLLVGPQMLSPRSGKLAPGTAEPLKVVLALHVTLQRALPGGREGAMPAAEGLTLVHRHAMIFEIVLPRCLEGTVGAAELLGHVD